MFAPERICGNYEPKEGDEVDMAFWMQGRIVDAGDELSDEDPASLCGRGNSGPVMFRKNRNGRVRCSFLNPENMLTAWKVIDFIFRTPRIVNSDPRDASFELSGVFWYPPIAWKSVVNMCGMLTCVRHLVFCQWGRLLHRQRKG